MLNDMFNENDHTIRFNFWTVLKINKKVLWIQFYKGFAHYNQSRIKSPQIMLKRCCFCSFYYFPI
jgi:hypothetical protein